jgi:hypothetical protein
LSSEAGNIVQISFSCVRDDQQADRKELASGVTVQTSVTFQHTDFRKAVPTVRAP